MAGCSVLCRCILYDANVLHKIRISCIFRCCSSHTNESHVPPPNVIKRYLLDRVTKFVDRRTSVLEKQYPKAFHIYRTFKTGFSGFVNDAKDYYRVSSELWNGKAFSHFSRNELEIYQQFPRDIKRFFPILLITLIPGGSFIFPLAYYYPKLLLTHHFWTEKQRLEFQQESLKYRLRHYPSILQYLRSHTRHVEDSTLKERILHLLNKIEHGVQPTVKEILDIKPLFHSFAYHMDKIPVTYVRHLGKAQDMSQRRKYLTEDALLLLNTDHAILKEGLNKLDDVSLEKVCFSRGLNPVGMRREERIDFLQQWIQISQHIDDESISLLLHCGVFLTYTQPTNKDLMGHHRKWQYSSS